MTGILGVDWSITATGVAWFDTQTGDKDTATFHTEPAGGGLREEYERLIYIRDSISVWADLHAHDLVVMEAPVFYAKSPHRMKMSAGWLMTAGHLARQVDDPLMQVSPKSLKKFTTGDGGASKADMIASVTAKYPGFTVDNDNEADAVALVAYGAHEIGYSLNNSPITTKKDN